MTNGPVDGIADFAGPISRSNLNLKRNVVICYEACQLIFCGGGSGSKGDSGWKIGMMEGVG